MSSDTGSREHADQTSAQISQSRNFQGKAKHMLSTRIDPHGLFAEQQSGARASKYASPPKPKAPLYRTKVLDRICRGVLGDRIAAPIPMPACEQLPADDRSLCTQGGVQSFSQPQSVQGKSQGSLTSPPLCGMHMRRRMYSQVVFTRTRAAQTISVQARHRTHPPRKEAGRTSSQWFSQNQL